MKTARFFKKRTVFSETEKSQYEDENENEEENEDEET